METNTDDGRTAITAGLSRRRMLKGSGAALAAVGLLGAAGFGNPRAVHANAKEKGMSENAATIKPNIVLVHGAWADGSCWSRVIQRLQEAGYTVTAPQFPLTTLAANLARLREVLAVQSDPTILAGHSYGGQIITALGTDAPNVAALVYIAAFGLDEGESIGALLGQGSPSPALAHLCIDAQGFAWIPQSDFVKYFAADVDPDQANVMYAVQQPLSVTALGDTMGTPAWRTLPSWYLVAKNDQALPPDAERFFAQRMGATTMEIASSHVAMVSHPDAVVKLIKGAYDCIKQFSEVDYTEDLKKMTVPTLIVHGDDDQIVPIAASALRSSKIVPQATLKVYSGAPHGLTATHQDQLNADLLAFLKA